MRYWVFEDWQTDRARIHKSECSYCNHGHGIYGGGSGDNSQWIGCDTPNDALRIMESLGRTDTGNCAHCGVIGAQIQAPHPSLTEPPRDDFWSSWTFAIVLVVAGGIVLTAICHGPV